MTVRRVVILGATKGMGRALVRKMAERGDRVFLLGRNEEDLRTSSADIEARAAGAAAGFARCDLESPDTFAPALDHAEAALNGLDVFVVTAALFASQDALDADPATPRVQGPSSLTPLLDPDPNTLLSYTKVPNVRARASSSRKLDPASLSALCRVRDGRPSARAARVSVASIRAPAR